MVDLSRELALRWAVRALTEIHGGFPWGRQAVRNTVPSAMANHGGRPIVNEFAIVDKHRQQELMMMVRDRPLQRTTGSEGTWGLLSTGELRRRGPRTWANVQVEVPADGSGTAQPGCA
ncbi:hypothetical protein GTS_47230 [Gandjariella thermophila]|uniref:Uncharacterized protein n=1 Tax=Gandjariella thermophila TaxID=1931992 RepID=A0A4D4JDJ4_9PSEU|nr:hypothetical protein GTS_47230 [Gandjariella thermophila]